MCGYNSGTNTVPSKTDTLYFPPVSGNKWETILPASLGWNTDSLKSLKKYLAERHTKAFIILVNGKIAVEEYFNGQIASDSWEWNSAGKTLLGVTTGIAQQEGLLNINNKVSDYLGKGWTSEPLQNENLITCKHLLTMTSGLNDERQIIRKKGLTYIADAGSRWSYSNVFQKMFEVVTATSYSDFETYFNNKLKDKIGMDGYWKKGLIFTIYHSTARSMARFGLMELNRGKWNSEQILNEDYFNESIHSSQTINPAYGYLTWLNGQSQYMLPGSQKIYHGTLIPNAPADMFAALGAKDQKLYIIPSKNMVIVRMGNAAYRANTSFAKSGFDNELWGKIKGVIK
ncbi:MAG: serine hydrolase [Ferruginibacter sp.]|nr:serine hydrolase [Ferruginibacter sp.]